MKKITRQSMQQKMVGNVLASLRIESLQPSREVVAGLQSCIDGKETTSHILEGVMRRHVTLRRI